MNVYDEKLLQALKGATFGPNASLTLPSGEVLDSDAANAAVNGEAVPEIVQAAAERLDRPREIEGGVL